MMEDSERRDAKRSRFDQTEPDPRRYSRFDRRSRSPPARKQESGRDRDRSPLAKGRNNLNPDVNSSLNPTAAAAAAAAKINASLQARNRAQQGDVQSIRSASWEVKDLDASGGIKTEIYVSDGDYIKDIEVNDLRNRYLLTKGATQKMIKDETGADVTTRGNYYPDKSMATPSRPPLYLHVTSTSKEGLEKAIEKIEELMQQELPQLVDERRFKRRDQEERPPIERDEFGRRKWPEEKLPIDLDPVPGFNLRAQVVGHGGAYVKHIQQETGCRVQIKGRGSGYIENATGREAEEHMYLHVAGPDLLMVQKAKELCEDLLANVKEEYELFKNRPPRNYERLGGHGDRIGYGDKSRGYEDRHDRDGHGSYSYQNNYNNSHHYNGAGSGSGAPASTPPAAPSTASAVDMAAQFTQYYGGADPYAHYGGYAAYMQMYQQWYAAAGQQGAAASAAAPGASTTQPPPPSEAAPPPPPPASAAPPPPPLSGLPGASGSNAVPPPSGL